MSWRRWCTTRSTASSCSRVNTRTLSSPPVSWWEERAGAPADVLRSRTVFRRRGLPQSGLDPLKGDHSLPEHPLDSGDDPVDSFMIIDRLNQDRRPAPPPQSRLRDGRCALAEESIDPRKTVAPGETLLAKNFTIAW